jgi:hypothetical protein
MEEGRKEYWRFVAVRGQSKMIGSRVIPKFYFEQFASRRKVQL